MQDEKKVDNSRPVEASELEIADTFQDAGTRPIEKSSDLLDSNRNDADDLEQKNNTNQDLSQEQNKINSVPPLD